MAIVRFESVRSDTEALFSKSDVFGWKELSHTPYLAFARDLDGTVTVRVITKQREMLALPDDTPLMVQWRGEWASHFFHFTVGEARRYLTEHNKTF